jgi:hypothetical protein
MFDHFINWLAYIFQNRTRTQTAWVLQGVSGTGKGILFNQIIRPLLGRKQCQSLNLENFEEQFNKSFETCLFAFIDEVDTNQMKNRDKVVAKLKTNITEPTIGIRAMHRDLREAPSHINFMMASNRHNSMRIDDNDRRFNVCQRQEKTLRQKYSDIPALLRSIESELQDFADFLYSYAVDVDMVRTPIENSAKKLLAGTTQTSSEAVANALIQGDLEFLMEHRPDREAYHTCKFDGNAYFAPGKRYLEIIETATQIASSNQAQVLDHADLFAIFELLVGKMPSTKIKLGKLVGHQGLEIKGHTSQGRSVRGCKVKWRTTKNKRAKWHQQIEQEKETAKLKSIEEQVQRNLSALTDKVAS